MTATKRTAIRKGKFGVRYASEQDHKRLGWIFKNVDTLRWAINAADLFLKENDLEGVLLQIVDHAGTEVETVSWEME